MGVFWARLGVKLCLAGFDVVLMVKDTCFGNALFLHWSQFVKILNFTKCEYLGLKSVAWVFALAWMVALFVWRRCCLSLAED